MNGKENAGHSICIIQPLLKLQLLFSLTPILLSEQIRQAGTDFIYFLDVENVA
jgi:hypothetical protein